MEKPSTLSEAVSVIKREYWGLKSNTVLLVAILLVPMAFGLFFGTFKNVVPKNSPAAIFPDGASEDDMRAAESILSYFSKVRPEKIFDENKLFREDYYLYVAVPKGFRDGPEKVIVYVDASMSPVSELSPYVKDMILYGLVQGFNWEPEIDIIAVGKRILSFQYFVPGIAMLLTAATGLLVVPLSLSRDKDVLRRVLSSMPPESFAIGMLSFAAILAVLQVAVLSATQVAAGTPWDSLIGFNPWSIGTMLLASVFFTSIGMSSFLLLRLGETGKQVNAALLGFTVAFSGAIYPVGFFPVVPGLGDILQSIGRANPAYLFTVMLRGFGLRELQPAVLSDYILLSIACVLASLLILLYSIRRYRHG